MDVDTLAIARKLRDAELPLVQADAIASEIGHAIDHSLANKSDLAAVIARLDANDAKLIVHLEALEQRLVAKIETMRSSMLIWLIGIIVAASGLLVTIGRVYFR